jgi:hypothetical protein
VDSVEIGNRDVRRCRAGVGYRRNLGNRGRLTPRKSRRWVEVSEVDSALSYSSAEALPRRAGAALSLRALTS